MGAAASIAKRCERGQDAEAERVERMVVNTLTYDDVTNYFMREFLRADGNRDKRLSYSEFVDFVQSCLGLNLRDSEVRILQKELDVDKDSLIDMNELLTRAPAILQKMYASLDPSGYDWCRFYDDNGHAFYFSKRTGETSWQQPQDFLEVHDVLLYKTRDLPSLVKWMEEQFHSSDFNCDGKLTPEEFRLFVNSMKLGLTDEQADEMAQATDKNADGVVVWEEAVAHMPVLLQRMYDHIEPGPHDWCRLRTTAKLVFYYNKRTGETSWDPKDIDQAVATG